MLVEGYTDVIALHQAGVPETVAQMGTALTEQQVDAIARLAPKALFCQDPDSAGQESVARPGHRGAGANKWRTRGGRVPDRAPARRAGSGGRRAALGRGEMRALLEDARADRALRGRARAGADRTPHRRDARRGGAGDRACRPASCATSSCGWSRTGSGSASRWSTRCCAATAAPAAPSAAAAPAAPAAAGVRAARRPPPAAAATNSGPRGRCGRGRRAAAAGMGRFLGRRRGPGRLGPAHRYAASARAAEPLTGRAAARGRSRERRRQRPELRLGPRGRPRLGWPRRRRPRLGPAPAALDRPGEHGGRGFGQRRPPTRGGGRDRYRGPRRRPSRSTRAPRWPAPSRASGPTSPTASRFPRRASSASPTVDIDDYFSRPRPAQAAAYLRGTARHRDAELPSGDKALARIVAELRVQADTLEATPAKLELEALQLELTGSSATSPGAHHRRPRVCATSPRAPEGPRRDPPSPDLSRLFRPTHELVFVSAWTATMLAAKLAEGRSIESIARETRPRRRRRSRTGSTSTG